MARQHHRSKHRSKPENEIIGISAVIGDQHNPVYSGIELVRVTEEEYPEGEIGWKFHVDCSELLARLKDLPSAIQQLDMHKSRYVRGRVLQEYADWKMLNDCYQLPEDLAVLIRLTIVQAEFEEQIWNAYIGL